MKTLLTGASGLVGSTINADLVISNRGQVDLRDWDSTYSYFKTFQPEAVIHTAARVGGLGANMNHMAEFYHDNILINTNVLEAARRTGVTKVVSFLSTCIFPDSAEYPLTEDQLHKGEPHDSNFGYSYAKRMLEVHSRAIANQYDLNYTCVIPTNIYGPNDNFNLQDSHVLPALIHKCYLAKRDNTELVVWGSGKPLREFIFSKDVGEITELILEHYTGSEPLILSTSEEISIREAVENIAEAMDFKGTIVFDDSKPDGQFRKPTCNIRLMDFLPEYKFTPFKEGIKQTVDWFVENYESCRK
jgi:GDP-L-fucose synthase